MKRSIVVVLVAILSAIFLTSCTGLFRSDEEKMNQKLEAVLSAIQNRDADYIESLFSEKAMTEAENFDASVERLFSFLEGEVLSYSFDAQGVDDSKSEGLVVTKHRYWYTVTTDKDEYMFFFLEYPRDQVDPNNKGLYMLQVIKKKDKPTQFDGGQNILYPGVYVPEE